MAPETATGRGAVRDTKPCPFYNHEAEGCEYTKHAFLIRSLSRSPGPGPAGRCYVAELPGMHCPHPRNDLDRPPETDGGEPPGRLDQTVSQVIGGREVRKYRKRQRSRAAWQWYHENRSSAPEDALLFGTPPD